MTNINKNLKEIRLSKNITQEEVANEIGLTRQAISSYESGRTQPGIDILMKLAEVYEVELEEILYGMKTYSNDKKIRNAAIALSIVYWIMFIARGVLRIIAHRVYSIPEGWVSEEYSGIVNIYFSLLQNADNIQYYIAKYYFYIALLVLLIIDIVIKNNISYKAKIRYIFYFMIISFVIDITLCLLDPLYLSGVYIYPVFSRMISIAMFLSIDLIIKYFQTKRR